MQHVGKNFPFTVRKDMIPPFRWPFNWPRRWNFETNALLGTLGSLWANQTFVSELADEVGADANVRWKFIHPTHTDQEVWFVLYTIENPPSGAFPGSTSFVMKIEYWNGSTRMGWWGPLGASLEFAPYLAYTGGNFFWLDLVNSAQFSSLRDSWYRPRSWAEQPEYRPRQPRP